MARVRFSTIDGYTVGAIDVPLRGAPGMLKVCCVGDDRADALARASLVAERIASDPIMRQLMPPQAMAAIKAAKGLAAAAKRGAPTLRAFWHTLRGPGKRRLAAVLHAEAVKRDPVGDIGDDELGFAPLAILAASLAKKYGPTVARKMVKAIKARRRRKALRKREAQHDDQAQHDEDTDQHDEANADDHATEATEQTDNAPEDDADMGGES